MALPYTSPDRRPPGALWFVHTADADETKLFCLVRVGGVNKQLQVQLLKC